jgi:hypothetical protein
MVMTFRGINLSAAIIVLICFFLPWEQISCGGARDTLTGIQLARDAQISLWSIPVVMALVATGGLMLWRRRSLAFATVSFLCGALVTYLMNLERLRVSDESGVIPAQLTGWFWLAFVSSLAVLVTGIGMFLRRQPAPQ